jgi:TM2 domain-containing membrane protein YozV
VSYDRQVLLAGANGNASCFFFLGSLGIDQFYAHHWPLALFKLLTLGAGEVWWFVDVALWMVGGVQY